jgi:branched-chain amino acid transport system permease protein
MTKRTIVRGSSQHRMWLLLGGALTAVVAVGLPFVTTDFRTFQFTLALVYAIAVLGLNLLTGYSGQISLGHSAFFGIGAYTAAILIDTHEWHYLSAIPVAMVLCFALGFLIGIPALRLHGLYLALLTLGLAVAFPPIVRRFESITGGSQGITVSSRRIQAPEWSGLSDDQFRYFVVLVVAVVLFVLGRNLVRSRVGRALTAIRDNEIPAQTQGIHLARYKTLVFAISAMYAGVAGVLYLYLIRFASPTSFLILLAINLLAAMVVGGLATVSGAIFGGLFMQFMPFYAQEVNQGLAGLVFGVVLIVFMILVPGGFISLVRRVRNRVVDVVDAPLERPASMQTPSSTSSPVTASQPS